MHCQIIQEEEM